MPFETGDETQPDWLSSVPVPFPPTCTSRILRVRAVCVSSTGFNDVTKSYEMPQTIAAQSYENYWALPTKSRTIWRLHPVSAQSHKDGPTHSGIHMYFHMLFLWRVLWDVSQRVSCFSSVGGFKQDVIPHLLSELDNHSLSEETAVKTKLAGGPTGALAGD